MPRTGAGRLAGRGLRVASGRIALTCIRHPLRTAVLLGGLLLWSPGALSEHYTIPLLVPAGASGEAQGVVRILNGTEASGTVRIYAIADDGARTGPAAFTLNPSAAVEFTATDMASGNADLGLSGGIGTDVGDARLEIETDLDIVPLAFVRAADGTLSAMHDTVRGASADESGQYTYDVPIFNPSTEMTRVSRLRLINPGDAEAAVTIGGRDDSGAQATGGDVTLMLAAGGAKTLTAQQLEAGDTDITGQLGAGTGNWRLTVSSDQPLEVVNIVASTAGHWNNLSTTAVRGAAPANLAAFNGRFVDRAVIYRTREAVATLHAAAGERFSETVESDGATATYSGGYGYEPIGPDAGRLTLSYDDGDACAASLYFASRTSGWFASHCTGADYPAEGTWLGGSWSSEDGEDDDGTAMETAYEVNDALPGVPTSGFFIPAVTSGGSVTASASGTTISLNSGGYIELNDGTLYTCASADGCSIVNGTVTSGTVTGRAPGAGEVDRFPSFRTAANPGDQTYTVGTAIDTLTLPEASGGNGELTYSLSPSVSGLTFNATTRQLTGTPSAAGTHAMTYTVTDEDGDTDTLAFTITVSAGTATEGFLGVCQVGMILSSGQSCTYPGTTDEFSVNVRGRGSFLGRLAGIRIRINNETIDGRVYDFEASHQGDGVWRIDRVAGSTEPPASVDIPDANLRAALAIQLGKTQDDPIYELELATLRELDAYNKGIQSLQGLQYATGLQRLDLGEGTHFDSASSEWVNSNRVSDLTPIAGLVNLTHLYLDHNAISDLSPLAGLENLQVLTLRLNRLRAGIEDISPLSGLTRLQSLSLSVNNVSDLSPLSGLLALQVLSLTNNLISDVSPLAGLTGLTSLHIGINRVENIEPLSGLTGLQRLWIGPNPVADISPIATLNRLENLYLGSTRVSDLAPVSGLANLRVLYLGSTRIEDISPLAELTALTHLYLDRNGLTDISPLRGLTELDDLQLARNDIVDVSPLSGLVNLRSLDLYGNEISDAGPLARNPGLGDGDRVDIRENPLDRASIEVHVPGLSGRGVDVRFTEILVTADDLPQLFNDNVFVLPVAENLSTDRLPLERYASRFFERFSDDFDFLFFLSNLEHGEDSTRRYLGAHFNVRNDTRGIGLETRTGSGWGSDATLQSVLHFVNWFGISNGPTLHEVMHRWANFIVDEHRPHWGFSSANGQLGGFDAADLVSLGDNRYTAGHFTTAGHAANDKPYSPIELYLAGFIPPADVPDLLVANDAAALRDETGRIVVADSGFPIFTASSLSTLTVSDIVAEHGDRIPGSTRSQKDFRAATILLIDRDHPASREQLEFVSESVSWFGYAGEDEHPRSYNFHEATGGRATLSMDGLSRSQSVPGISNTLGVASPAVRTLLRESLQPGWTPGEPLDALLEGGSESCLSVGMCP